MGGTLGDTLGLVLARIVWGVLAFLSFNRIGIVHAERLPRRGPVLYVGLHRNGVMDGAVYLRVAPRARFVISAQWHRSLAGRLLFPGISVAREKDRGRGIQADNSKAFAQGVDHLKRGGELFILPEGTSALGPSHLPFKPGAARLACEAAASGVPLTVVPLGIHYERAWEWQSRVEVLVGEPFEIAAGARPAQEPMEARIAASLEAVGINVATEERLRFIEALAYAATLGTQRGYAKCLKRLEPGVPPELEAQAAALLDAASAQGAMLHQGVPLIPLGSVLPYLMLWLALAPLEAAFFASNAPAIFLAVWASRKFPDGRNVIALWRMLVGMPAGTLWVALVSSLLLAFAGPLWALLYLGVCVAGIVAYYRSRKISVALYNAVFARGLRAELLSFRTALAASLDAQRR